MKNRESRTSSLVDEVKAKTCTAKRGFYFTLIELLVVIAIISILEWIGVTPTI